MHAFAPLSRCPTQTRTMITCTRDGWIGLGRATLTTLLATTNSLTRRRQGVRRLRLRCTPSPRSLCRPARSRSHSLGCSPWRATLRVLTARGSSSPALAVSRTSRRGWTRFLMT
eukprot:1176883-Pleurochrysis_carterae.AAC.1